MFLLASTVSSSESPHVIRSMISRRAGGASSPTRQAPSSSDRAGPEPLGSIAVEREQSSPAVDGFAGPAVDTHPRAETAHAHPGRAARHEPPHRQSHGIASMSPIVPPRAGHTTVSLWAPIGNGAARSPPCAAISARNRSIAVPSSNVCAGSTASKPARRTSRAPARPSARRRPRVPPGEDVPATRPPRPALPTVRHLHGTSCRSASARVATPCSRPSAIHRGRQLARPPPPSQGTLRNRPSCRAQRGSSTFARSSCSSRTRDQRERKGLRGCR